MKKEEFFEEFDGYEGDLSKVFDKFDSAKKDRIFVNIIQFLKAEIGKRSKPSSVAPQETSFYTVKEAAVLLKVSGQTIHNWKNSGQIKFRKIGGSIRFTLDDLLSFCFNLGPKLVPNIEPNIEHNLAVCKENVIYIDKEKQEVVPFEKNKIYKIINENKIWVTLVSKQWEQAARFSKKRFRKFFSIADDRQIAQIKYNLKNLS